MMNQWMWGGKLIQELSFHCEAHSFVWEDKVLFFFKSLAVMGLSWILKPSWVHKDTCTIKICLLLPHMIKAQSTLKGLRFFFEWPALEDKLCASLVNTRRRGLSPLLQCQRRPVCRTVKSYVSSSGQTYCATVLVYRWNTSHNGSWMLHSARFAPIKCNLIT